MDRPNTPRRPLKLVPPPPREEVSEDDLVPQALRPHRRPDGREVRLWEAAVDRAWESRADAKPSADRTQRALLKLLRWRDADLYVEGRALTRLLRLVVLHRDDLDERRRRASFRTDDVLSLRWELDRLGGSHLGLGEDFAGLVLELAASGDLGLTNGIITLLETAEYFGADVSAGRAHVAVWRELTARVPTQTDGQRTCTLAWLAWSQWPGAAAALRWSLRPARLPDRRFALEGLGAIPGALTARDVMFVLEDACRRRIEFRSGACLSAVCLFAGALRKAVLAVRPAGAAARLLRFARDAGFPEDGAEELDHGWALALATRLDPPRARRDRPEPALFDVAASAERAQGRAAPAAQRGPSAAAARRGRPESEARERGARDSPGNCGGDGRAAHAGDAGEAAGRPGEGARAAARRRARHG